MSTTPSLVLTPPVSTTLGLPSAFVSIVSSPESTSSSSSPPSSPVIPTSSFKASSDTPLVSSAPNAYLPPNAFARSPSDESSSSSLADDDDDLPIALRKGTHQCTRTPVYPLSHYMSFDQLSPPYLLFLSRIDLEPVPCRLADAIASPRWKAAMDDEMHALLKSHTWDIVPLPPRKHVVDCKWVHAKNHHADGTLARLKSRLVARGFTQSYDIDYFETFSLVAKMDTVHLLLTLAARFYGSSDSSM